MVVQTCNSCTQKAKAVEFQVQVQPELHSRTISQEVGGEGGRETDPQCYELDCGHLRAVWHVPVLVQPLSQGQPGRRGNTHLQANGPTGHLTLGPLEDTEVAWKSSMRTWLLWPNL